MITRLKTKGIRLCDCDILGDIHKNILLNFEKIRENKNINKEDTIGYTLDTFYDEKSKIGFSIVKYKIFYKDYSTELIEEQILSLNEDKVISIKEEFKLFIK